MGQKQSDAERFWAKVRKGKADQCWLWLGARSTSARNYVRGNFLFRGRTRHAASVAWELSFGPIPLGQGVLHTCDQPLCVNPVHLFLGDQRINMRDCSIKGRLGGIFPRGEKHPHAKLSSRTLLQIFRRVEQGESRRAIARDLGVCSSTVVRIVKGQRRVEELRELNAGPVRPAPILR